MPDRRTLSALLLLLAALLFLELPGSRLIDPDEPRYAEIPREMLATGDWVTPRLNGAHYFEKPPLLYWLNAASIAAFGRTEFAARLPTRLAALGTAALLVAALEGTAANWGLWAAIIFLSSPLGFVLGRFNLTDGVLTCALTITLLAMRSFLLARERDERATGSLAALGVGAGLAMLTKGLIGIVFPGLTFLAWIALVGRWRRLRELLISPAPIAFLVVAVPWFVLVERANPGFSRFFFIHEHFQRFATDEAKRGGPIYYFLAVFLVGFLPWTVLLPRALAPVLTRSRAQLRAHMDELLFALWGAIILVFFSLSQSKLIPYILPVVPAAAALVARSILREPLALRRPLGVHLAIVMVFAASGLGFGLASGEIGHYAVTGPAVGGALALVLGALLAFVLARRAVPRTALIAATLGWAWAYVALTLALPSLSRDLSSHDLAVAAREAVPGAKIVAWRAYPQSFPWVLGHPIPVADFKGELGSDGVLPPDLYWSSEEFWRRWNSGEPMVVVTRRRRLPEFEREARRPPRALGGNRKYLIATNVPARPAQGPP